MSITITASKANKLTFTMDISGVSDKSSYVTHFVIALPDMKLAFPCEKSGSNWVASIAAIPFAPAGDYDCYVEVMVDSYYFKPFTSTCSITAAPALVVSEPKNEDEPATSAPTVKVSDPVVSSEESEKEEKEEKADKKAKDEKEDKKDEKKDVKESAPSFTDMIKQHTKKERINSDLLKTLKR